VGEYVDACFPERPPARLTLGSRLRLRTAVRRPGEQEVLAEIKRGSGAHFDPRIVVHIAAPGVELNEELAATLKRDKSLLMLRPATV
jgi:hypothetical protein